MLNKIDQFIFEYPEYTREGVDLRPPMGTNRVVFARRGQDKVVFKVFCEEERKERECFALRHWHKTGLVPHIIWDDDPTMVILSWIPGLTMGEAREQGATDAEFCTVYQQIGEAFATLNTVPLSPADQAAFENRFYSDLGPLDSYLERILELAKGVHVRDPDFQDVFWGESLDFIEEQLNKILNQPRLLYHQDAGNLHIKGERLIGFFDLEMCRVGGFAMQLAAAPGVFYEDGSNPEELRKVLWRAFRRGWEDAIGNPLSFDDLEAITAANHLLNWREITRYLSYDGTPGTGFSWANPADPVRYRNRLEPLARVLQTQ